MLVCLFIAVQTAISRDVVFWIAAVQLCSGLCRQHGLLVLIMCGVDTCEAMACMWLRA